MMRVRDAVISFVLGSFLSFGCLSVAGAAKPFVEGPVHDEGQAFVADCGSFEVLDDFVQDITVTYFFDQQGELIKLLIQIQGTDSFLNSVTGKTFPPMHYHNMLVINDPASDIATFQGIVFRLTVPGLGVVFRDIGRITLDRQGNFYFEAAQHQYFEGDIAGLCSALT
jgi:hypothetical protein